MGVYGALFSGVSGLIAEGQNMGIISDNISNANTVGYKASEDKFETLVTSPATTTTYTPGGVLSRPFANVSAQGLLEATSSTTDVGITGNGFLPVTSSVSTGGVLDSTVSNVYTRAGSFTIDKNGNLVNSAGFYLLGVPINQTTNQPSISNPSVQALSLVNVGTLTGIAKGTTTLSIGANLPAVPTEDTPLSVGGTITTAAALPATVDASTYTVYSSNGNAYTLSNVTYTGTAAPAGTPPSETVTVTAKITALGTSPVPNATAITLGTFNVTASGSTFTAGTGATFSDESTYDPTMSGTALKLGTTTAISSLAVDPQDVTAVVYDSLGVAENLTLEFSRFNPAGTTSNTWVTTIKSMTVEATGANATSATLPEYVNGTANSSAVAQTAVGLTGNLVVFNTNGTISSTAPTTLGGTTGLPMNDGAANFGGTGFSLNLGEAGTPSGLTQYSSKFDVSFLNQNGLAFSFRTGVAFNSDGVVSAIFDNGTTIPLYQIPLVNFANVDGLQAETGNVYQQTVQSGDAVSNYAGLGGVGTMTPSALEQSTVDLSTEFANLIITQRAFSANARTITTADSELGEVVNLVR
jgi:flagellar hook protein FlgE